MPYVPTLTDQKIDFLLSIELPARYVSIKYVFIESYTRQKWVCLKTIESSTQYILGRMQYAPTLTDQKIDSPLKPPTRSDPFLVYRCRGVWHTPHKCP